MANQDSIGEKAIASSGNVFADLGLSEATERQTKVRLAVAINGILDLLELPQVDVARRLRISQPRVSALKNYRLEGLSIEKLMHFLNALDQGGLAQYLARPPYGILI